MARNPMINALLSLSLALPLGLSLACNRNAEAVKAEQQAAQAETDRVAKLEQELAEVKGGKMSHREKESLEKQIADAKRRKTQHEKEAEQLSSGASSAPKAVVVSVPAGTSVAVKLDKELSTATAKAGDAWSGTLVEDVSADGKIVFSAGTPVSGVVSKSDP